MSTDQKPVIEAAKHWADVRSEWLRRGGDILREKLTEAEMRLAGCVRELEESERKNEKS